jgi:hypothetical protein
MPFIIALELIAGTRLKIGTSYDITSQEPGRLR